MIADGTRPAWSGRFEVPLPALLDKAQARLRRQSHYARSLAKGGARVAGIEELLEQAAACVTALARPAGALIPVRASATGNGICIERRVVLDGVDLARDVANGAGVTAYLLTLGYEQARAFGWLESDYAAHHVQSDLGREVLFAFGRQVFEAQRARALAGARLRRIPVLTGSSCGGRRFWSARKVQALLGVFEGVDPGVSVTATGCFQPLHSLLGLTISV